MLDWLDSSEAREEQLTASALSPRRDDDDLDADALGDRFSEYYVTSRAWELKAWRETVTDWAAFATRTMTALRPPWSKKCSTAYESGLGCHKPPNCC